MATYDNYGINSPKDYVSQADRIQKTTALPGQTIIKNAEPTGFQLDFQDFLNLMVAELQNQDFTDPVDNTEYMNQMMQMSSVSAMTELATYSKNSYTLGLVGKTVTASKSNPDGTVSSTTGVVSRVVKNGDGFIVYVNGTAYEPNNISAISSSSVGGLGVDPSNIQVQFDPASLSSSEVSVSWALPAEDEATLKGLTYVLMYSDNSQLKTVEDMLEHGVEVRRIVGTTNAKDLQATIKGLNRLTSYSFNVLVMDEYDNVAIYKPENFITKA